MSTSSLMFDQPCNFWAPSGVIKERRLSQLIQDFLCCLQKRGALTSSTHQPELAWARQTWELRARQTLSPNSSRCCECFGLFTVPGTHTRADIWPCGVSRACTGCPAISQGEISIMTWIIVPPLVPHVMIITGQVISRHRPSKNFKSQGQPSCLMTV